MRGPNPANPCHSRRGKSPPLTLAQVTGSVCTVHWIGCELDLRQRTGSQAQEQHVTNNVSHSAVESELRERFRPANSQVASAGQADEGGHTGGSLRYQTQLHFGKWNSRPRK
ncbi:hypothetical protein JOQ06_028559, partial [Pogonophryne albipinna]